MSEENKQQIERICTEVNKLDASKQEIILAFAQGLVCGTKHTEKSAYAWTNEWRQACFV